MASEFWRYFRDVLRWPLIHAPGPLSCIVKGAALALDSAREDSIFFRCQWFPALCEPELVARFGTSRGLIRHPKESAAQFRARVVNAWNWHFLGGKTKGLPEILKFYGFDTLSIENLRQFQPSRWAEFQLGLKTPATQAEQEALLSDLDTLVWLVNEYKPARSVLARVYTDTYDRVPAVWSGGPVSEHGWSNGFWSRFSGVTWPGQGSGENSDIIVSFGMNHRCQSEPCNATGAGMGVVSRTGFLAPYLDRPVWSRSFWGEIFPKNHGFTIGEILSVHWCVRTTASWPWEGEWDSHPWQKYATWDRILPHWTMRKREWARVEAVFSWPGDSGEPGDLVKVHGNGTWGDVNACYGRPRAVMYQGTRWGAPWGADPERRELELLERQRDKSGITLCAVHPADPFCAGLSVQAEQTAPIRKRGWQGPWSGRRWLADICLVHISKESVRSE